jgi:Uma2 family endonuclease
MRAENTWMSDGAIRRMTADEFLEWDLTAPDCRHELVDGVPVPQHGWEDGAPTAMTCANRRHDRVVMNTQLALGRQLRGGPCTPFSADVAIRIPNCQIRRPDVGVDCGEVDERTTFSDSPRLLVEVLSPSTRAFDRVRKLEEYKSLLSLAYILLIDAEVPEVLLWSRADGIWSHAVLAGVGATVEMPWLGLRLCLADMYEGLTFRPLPRLVLDQG